jgi:hypothetical protein
LARSVVHCCDQRTTYGLANRREIQATTARINA